MPPQGPCIHNFVENRLWGILICVWVICGVSTLRDPWDPKITDVDGLKNQSDGMEC